MQSRRANSLNLPALIPVAGNFDHKPRSIDRDVTTIGRARGSDLCLEANEISTLHCIIFRTAEGYRIRDCNSRSGTRVNGQAVKNSRLHNCDIINVGAFSFEFSVPTSLFPQDDVRLDPVQIEHWKASRLRLAQLALKLRRRLRDGVSGGSHSEEEWKHKAQLLKDKIRCYDQRLSELEAAEEELTEERRQLAVETENQRRHVQETENQLAERLAQADQEIHQRWQEFQQRCQAEEVRQQHAAPAWSAASDDAAIQRQQERLRELDAQLNQRADQLQREQQEFSTMKDQWVNGQAKSSAAFEKEQAALVQKKGELLRMMGDLKKMQDDLRRQAKPDVRALHDEVERLERANAELRACAEENQQLQTQLRQLQEDSTAALPSADATARQFDDLNAEIALLREELENKENALAAAQAEAGGDAEQTLRAENGLLKQLLEEKSKLVDEMTQASQRTPKTENDLERYETELNELRRQLEGDRTKLNKEVEILRDRNKELDEAIREMEMELSKERAELGRERMRLERVREEVKADAERLQRELAVRDSMAPVQKLRDEIAQKQGPAGKTDKPLNDRLRSMRNQLSDSSPAGS